jgi:threonine/homoserine/homoserine lactone efflux protein
MHEFLLPGILIGLSAGFSPGALMTLVISQTLHHGLKEGVKVAIAPLLTDLPIIIIIVFTLALLSNIDIFLAVISFLGAFYLAFLGYESMKVKGVSISTKDVKPQSLRKGVFANLLNPAPYFFYFTIGGPLIIKSLHTNPWYGVVFVVTFSACLVLSKVLIAYITEWYRPFLKSAAYVYINRILGLLLLFYALKFLQEGWQYLF